LRPSCRRPASAGAALLWEETMLRRSLLIFAAVAASSQLALAADVIGEWMRDNGEAKVRFSPCGAAVCGRLS